MQIFNNVENYFYLDFYLELPLKTDGQLALVQAVIHVMSNCKQAPLW